MLHRLYWPLSEAWMSRGCRNSGSWSRRSTEDTLLSLTQTALLHSLDAQTPPIWGYTEKRHYTETCKQGQTTRRKYAEQFKKQNKGITHGPDSTMTEPILCVFSNASLHSPDSSTFFPRKFSYSKTANCKTGGELDDVWSPPLQRITLHSISGLFQHTHTLQLGTLYVAPAPPWPLSAGSWSGFPCCSVIFSLQSTAITLFKWHKWQH